MSKIVKNNEKYTGIRAGATNGGKIPSSIKTKVIKEWLAGISRNVIVDNNQISYGSVTNIIKEVKTKDIQDIDLLREVALILKKEDLDLAKFAIQ